MLASIYAAGLLLLLTGVTSCTARDYTDRQRAADQEDVANHETQFYEVDQKQPGETTESMDERTQVQSQARQAAEVLKELVGMVLQLPNGNQRVASGLTQDVAQLSSRLDAIAASRNDQEFTAAVIRPLWLELHRYGWSYTVMVGVTGILFSFQWIRRRA